jgi:hypothetical protein
MQRDTEGEPLDGVEACLYTLAGRGMHEGGETIVDCLRIECT